MYHLGYQCNFKAAFIVSCVGTSKKHLGQVHGEALTKCGYAMFGWLAGESDLWVIYFILTDPGKDFCSDHFHQPV